MAVMIAGSLFTGKMGKRRSGFEIGSATELYKNIALR
jgi:hypothetical protein